MPLVLGGSAVTAVTQANSCRFNLADSPDLSLSQAAGTSTKKLTVSMWIKRGGLGAAGTLWSTGTGTADGMQVAFYQDKLVTESWDGSVNPKIEVTRIFRDTTAWYHLVMVWDTTDAAAADRIRLYINGAELTDFIADVNPSLNYDIPGWSGSGDTVAVGKEILAGSWTYFDGYLAEVCCLDGQALGPTSFGEFDSDSPTIWKPIDVSGLTFGTNGFYLDFADSSALGTDAAGSNNLTATNLAAVDQCVDTPTNNFSTMNSLDNYYQASTFSEGNNVVVTSSGNSTFNTATVPLQAGKWYAEIKCGTVPTYTHIGISDKISTGTSDSLGDNTYEYSYLGYNGNIVTGASSSSYGDTYTTGDIIGIYLDLDNSKLYFGKNGTVQNSGTGVSISAVSGAANSWYVMAFGDEDGGATATGNFNFGNGSFGGTAVSSGNTDTNGYGNFEYDPSSGTFDGGSKDFLAICTKNLGSDGG